MSNKRSTRTGNITEFDISSTNGSISVEAAAGIVDLNYYESLWKNTSNLVVQVVESGESDNEKLGNKGMLDGLPLRGGNAATISFEDNVGGSLKFKGEDKLYLNRIKNVMPGTQKDTYTLEFKPREYFANETCRVVKRYDGKISENVKKILTEATSKDVGIKTKKSIENIDNTLQEYNFIGNDRKPFDVIQWLTTKSIPEGAGKEGGAAGYFFYETHDGFNFKSIDVLLGQESKGKYIFTNTADTPPKYKGKIIKYTIDRDMDLGYNLSMGAYSNRTLFLDPINFDYKARNFSVNESGPAKEKEGAGSKGKIQTATDNEIDYFDEQFGAPPSRLMSRVLDPGVLPSGKDVDDELKKWKEEKTKPTFDAAETMVQCLMRYNQLFSVKINIIIPGDFNLRVGDLIECEFPEQTTNPNPDINRQSGGKYIIAELRHRLTTKDTFTYLTLVRDTFNQPSKSD